MGRALPLLSLLTFVLALSQGTLAATQVGYIDDNDKSGVTYSPSNQWSYGPTCTTCYTEKYAKLDTSDAYGGSWHETTLMQGGTVPSITLTFTGTTIDVYCIVLNYVPHTNTHAAYNFVLDGAQGTPYTHAPDSTSTILYNVPVFSKAGLSNTQHTLEIQPFLQPGSDQTLILFDYAQYTFGEPDVSTPATPQPPPSTPQPPPSTPQPSPSTSQPPPSTPTSTPAAPASAPSPSPADSSIPPGSSSAPGVTSTQIVTSVVQGGATSTFTDIIVSSSGASVPTIIGSGVTVTAYTATSGTMSFPASLVRPLPSFVSEKSGQANLSPSSPTSVGASQATPSSSDSTSPNRSSISLAAVVGAALGGVCALLIALFVVLRLRRRRAPDQVQPFPRDAEAFAKDVEACSKDSQSGDDRDAGHRNSRVLLQAEIDQLRVDHSNVHILEAEIERLRAAYAEGSPPTYGTAAAPPAAPPAPPHVRPLPKLLDDHAKFSLQSTSPVVPPLAPFRAQHQM